jgi:molybdenum cofactor biosynthesis enzyme MoaA
MRRPGQLGHRRDARASALTSDGEAVDKGVASLQKLGLDDISVNLESLSRCVLSPLSFRNNE